MKKMLEKIFGRPGTYQIDVWCNNCEKKLPVYVKKGTKVDDAMKGKVCPNCGCDTIRRELTSQYY